eukprot:CAMPEP_0205870566 /NCGR_PEP_ID=MMETSP1083-20121108/10629_1 /ASSEMBLY_ACC=CAM_ASM_000430 /TAXON_ID=97485 /ORGANISM="Prymnesium parvum, Strain Texoma1" /LENGTH=43 /DNA_ID= /DNA_START= /DNA_END= /DNA_ORIENTATION=
MAREHELVHVSRWVRGEYRVISELARRENVQHDIVGWPVASRD